MNPNDKIRLLILNDSRNEAERLISMLRNAGRPSRAQHVESEEALIKLLQEQVWDLLIAHDQTQNLSHLAAIKQIRRLNKDVPVILQTEGETSQPIVDGIKYGAADVVKVDEDQHLLLVIQRELDNREQRQARRRADRRYHEAERRSQQLLDSSRDAVAYIQDGLYLYVNESFAERFGYEDKDDLECMPVIDMICKEDQENVKKFFKEFALKGDDTESTALEFNGLSQDGTEGHFYVEVAHAIYDEEPCIQCRIPAHQANSEELQEQITQIKQMDITTGLYNRHFLMERLEHMVDSATHNGLNSALLYIDIDNFQEKVQINMGMTISDAVVTDIAHLINAHSNNDEVLARFGDGTFVLLTPGISADAALERAEDICRKVEDHIVDVDGKTLQLTLSIGVALISETVSSADSVLDQAVQAVETVHSRSQVEGIGNGASLFEPESIDFESGSGDIAVMVQRALDNNLFRLLFQPVISLRGSDEEHYEVLLRMINEKNGEVITPSEFLSAAAQIGAMIKIDRWVILESIKILSNHLSKGNHTRMIINLSSQSMCDEGFLPWLKVAFKAANLCTNALVFQVNEADVTNHLTAAKRFIEGLAKIKSLSAISNFGCSLNPFNTLKHVDFNYVKIDGSFTLDIQNSNESPEALSNLIKQLHAEKKTTIVPFVENASVLSTLWQAGVHYIQGHYLQAPTDNMDYDFNMEG